MSQRELARRCGATSQFFGIQASVLENGVERGIRCLEFRTGTGLRFSVLVDRALDISTAEFQGVPLSWHSPTGFRHPALHENADEQGLGWLRSFSGLLVTGGLDHILGMTSEATELYNHRGRPMRDFPLHGRVANIPAQLLGYGESWIEERCTLWCEGTIVQATVLGENLHLTRRIEAVVGESSLTIKDRVVNRGFLPTPHMFLYHINLGYPLLDEGAEYVAPICHTIWASHAEDLQGQSVGYRIQSGPRERFREQLFEHALVADCDGKVPVALINRACRGGRGLGLAVETNKREFPCHIQWQCFQEGLYTLALEPCTNHVLGRAFARERGELTWLEHAQQRQYTTTISVLEDNASIDGFVHRVGIIEKIPQADFPKITGRWGLNGAETPGVPGLRS